MQYKVNLKTFGIYSGILVFAIIWLFGFPNAVYEVRIMAAIAALTAIWWMTEAMPLAVTSLVPIVLLPVFGIMKGSEVATEYFNSTILIYLGGFLIALAMQRWDLHKRISLIIIRNIGTSPSKIILGFMVASCVLSMFISNIATTVMLLPIGLAIIYQIEEMFDESNTHNFSLSLMLGIAYAASIGGIATLIGTAPNLIFQRIYEISFPDAEKITFAKWFMFGFPISVIFLGIAYFTLTKLLYKPSSGLEIHSDIIDDEYKKLGKMSFEEKVVLFLLILTALLWLTRPGLNLGFINIIGWAELLPFGDKVDDGTVAITTAILLFLIPAKNETRRVLDLKIFPKIPWDVILIFGGGFALAKGFTTSGLSEYIGNEMQMLGGIHPIILTLSICFILTFMTELTSNTATSNTVLPILASIAIANDIDPLVLMLPATISASFAFMLPVATPPNAVVYGTGRIKVGEMVKAGFILNLVGVVVITFMFYTLGKLVHGF